MSDAKTRNAQRQAYRAETPAARKVAASLLPDSPRSLATRIATQSARLVEVQSLVPEDGAQAAVKHRKISQETKALAGLVAASKAMRQRRLVKPTGVKHIGKEAAKARKSAVQRERKAVQQQIVAVEKARKKARGSVKMGLEQQKAVLQAKERELITRTQLLGKDSDLDLPPRFAPSALGFERKPLTLSPAFVPPTKSEVIVAAQSVAQALKPKTTDTPEEQKLKIHGLTERVLVRQARNKMLAKPPQQALADAVVETLRVDGPTIEAEVKLSGGLAQDPAAQAMAPFISDSLVEVHEAAEQVKPPVPMKDPTAAEVHQVLQEAQAEMVKAQAMPKEASDEMREDLLFADQKLVEKPLWKNPLVLGAGALLLFSYLRD